MEYNNIIKYDSCMVENMAYRKQYNTAIYIRLSKEDGDKEVSNSVSVQRTMLKDYVQSHDDLVLYDIYIDDGFTGTNFNRPDFQRMISDIENGNVNCVIVKDLSRLGRDYIDTGNYLQKYFPRKRVRFIAVTDHIDNSGNEDYDMLLPIRNIINEQYARDISVKVQSSFKTKQKSGEFVGAFCSYGYMKSPIDKHKLIIDDEAASVVKKIFSLYVNGHSKLGISRMLNENGIPCPTEYKKRKGQKYVNSNKLGTTTYWTYSTINKILNNEMYCGHMIQGKTKRRMKEKPVVLTQEEWIVVENTHEPIITKELWEKAKHAQSIRTRQLNLNDNIGLFCGLIVCGDCGRALHKKVDKGKYTYYRCGSYVTYGKEYCTSHNISEKILIEIILLDVNSLIQKIENLINVVIEKQNSRFNTKIDSHEKEILRIEKELEKVKYLKKSVYEDYKDNLITKAEFISYREEYSEKETLLENSINELKNTIQSFDVESIIQSEFIQKLLNMKKMEVLTREILLELIDKITVYNDNRIKITYTFSNELNILQEFIEEYKLSS